VYVVYVSVRAVFKKNVPLCTVLVRLESGKGKCWLVMIGPLLLEYRKIELRQEEKKDTKSPEEVCRPDFSSSSMVTGQVAGWCVGRERS
jgi:hypothetical protein